ncbi:MAG TPA: phosphoribosylanthranilate isomerase [Edaphobacter sp.]|jgi:phosphoribosylanthranilate isomerase|nr:phosphoribosylanthranilate isomerase [Edaphobacter sp.]
MWIKICANTNLEDARLAAELGADAVGFVFAPSARRVTVAQVAAITPHLPVNVERVGVFPALAADEIVRVAEEAGLNAVQLHGGFDLARLKELLQVLDGRMKLIQTLHWAVDADGVGEDVARQLREVDAMGLVDRVLIDSKIGAASGGSGVSFNWGAARVTLADAAGGLKVIVAGGLREENVAEAIARLNPWGVDVASGVEAAPGKKSPEKLAGFIRAARSFTPVGSGLG